MAVDEREAGRICVLRHDDADRGELLALADGLGHMREDAPMRPLWQAILAGRRSPVSSMVVARREGVACGVAVAFRRPLGGGGRMVLVWVLPERRRQGIGSALIRGLAAEMAPAGVTGLVAMEFGEEPDVAAFLRANGFRAVSRGLQMVSGDGPAGPVPDGPDDISCTIYEGGDPTVDGEIADFLNHSLRRDPMGGGMTAAAVADVILDNDAWFVIARDPATGTIAGLTECHANGFFAVIAVARKFWGTGLAQKIGSASVARFAARGCTAMCSHVDKANVASIRVHEQFGWRRDGEVTFHLRDSGVPPVGQGGIGSAGA